MTLRIRKGMPLAAALGGGRLAIAGPEVPAGKYARASLTALGVWDSVKDRLARAENVRGALAFVARGETPLGIVYDTDAKIEPKRAHRRPVPGRQPPADRLPRRRGRGFEEPGRAGVSGRPAEPGRGGGVQEVRVHRSRALKLSSAARSVTLAHGRNRSRWRAAATAICRPTRSRSPPPGAPPIPTAPPS